MNLLRDDISLSNDFGFPPYIISNGDKIKLEYEESELFKDTQCFRKELEDGDIQYCPSFGFNSNGDVAPPNRTERYIRFSDSVFAESFTATIAEMISGNKRKIEKIIVLYSKIHLDRVAAYFILDNKDINNLGFPDKIDGFPNVKIKYDRMPGMFTRYSFIWFPNEEIDNGFFGFSKDGNARSIDSKYDLEPLNSDLFKKYIKSELRKCLKAKCKDKNEKYIVNVGCFDVGTSGIVGFLVKTESGFPFNVNELNFPRTSIDGTKIFYEETPLYCSDSMKGVIQFESNRKHIIPFGLDKKGELSPDTSRNVNIRTNAFKKGLKSAIEEYIKSIKEKHKMEFKIIVHYSQEDQFLTGLSCIFKDEKGYDLYCS